MDKLKVALVGTIRPIFKGDMVGVLNHSIETLTKKSEELGFDFIPVHKGMETMSDAQVVAKQLESENVDFIIIQNSSFADGDMIIPFFSNTARLAVWAVEETTDSGPLPLNSFCATNLYMSIAGRFSNGYDKPVKWLYGNAESKDFAKRFEPTVRALSAIKKLQQSKILMIGDFAPGYHDEKFDDEKLRKIFGIRIEKVELTEFYSEFEEAIRSPEVPVKVEEILYESSGIDVAQPDITKSARAEVAFQKIISKRQGSAITFRCWPEVPGKIGLMVCSTIGRLNQGTTVAATEGDVLGAISMLALKYLSNRDTVLMDLSAWDKLSDSIYIWHCGNIPNTWFDENGFRLSNHFNRNTIGVVRDGKMKSGEVTGLRFLENDQSAFLVSGNFTDKGSPRYKGCSAWMNNLKINERKVTSKDFMNTLLVNAIPHHLAYVDQDISTEVNEFCAWLGILLVETIPYKDYLQKPPMFMSKSKDVF
jgi:L-fucose isomerase-like protein